mgnify:CR=1 FL=1
MLHFAGAIITLFNSDEDTSGVDKLAATSNTIRSCNFLSLLVLQPPSVALLPLPPPQSTSIKHDHLARYVTLSLIASAMVDSLDSDEDTSGVDKLSATSNTIRSCNFLSLLVLQPPSVALLSLLLSPPPSNTTIKYIYDDTLSSFCRCRGRLPRF